MMPTAAIHLPTISVTLFTRIAVSVFVLFTTIPLTLSANSHNDSIVHSISEIQSGALLLPNDTEGTYTRAPLLDTAVNIGVQGMLARTNVKQTFTNNTSDWIEAIYVFPLPDDASVDELNMTIGDRRISGQIQTKARARAQYETAKRAGKKASLLDQQRANLFTTRVANIPPGESIRINIGYQSSVRYTDGQFELYFPLTITPRYIPGTAVSYDSNQLANHTGTGWAQPTNQVPDADTITPPITDNPAKVSIQVSLNTGLDLITVVSSTHEIVTSDPAKNKTRIVTLANNSVPADRDFKLNWATQTSKNPVAAVFRQDTVDATNTKESFASLMLMPPQEIFQGNLSREVIFVMDTSSSMSGQSIIQARKALTLGIARLTNNEFFNVIEFDSDTNSLFPQSVVANNHNKTKAINWVASLYADQGTEILGAMRAALRHNSNAETNERIRQIVFVTDGSVGNEDEIFRFLQRNIGQSRLFTVGIGSAPNIWFMRKAAELGRGTYTNINNTSELTEKTLKLLTKLERPVLTDIQITFETDVAPEVFPQIIPDVYMGEPVLADARWGKLLTNGNVVITGKYAGANWTQKLSLATPEPNPSDKLSSQADDTRTNSNDTRGLDKLWAYRKIQSLEDSLLFGADPDETEKAITQVALLYSLVTRYTSLLAVEEKISRQPEYAFLKTAAVPQAIPHGNTMLLPQGSLGTNSRFFVALIFALLSVLFALATLRQTQEPGIQNYGE